MLPLRTCSLALSMALLAIAADLGRPPPEDEPPLRFLLAVDGQEYEAEEGRPFELTVGDRKVEACVRVQPTRHFASAGLSFEYPRSMAYEHQVRGDVTIWSLDGIYCSITVHSCVTDDAAELARRMLLKTASRFSAPVGEICTIELQLGDAVVPAYRLEVKLGSAVVTMVYCGLLCGGKPVVIWLQDTSKDGAQTAEMTEIRALLAKTFRRQPG